MTLAEIRQRIEKGCKEGRNAVREPAPLEYLRCGSNTFNKKIDKNKYCRECTAQLKLLDEIEGEMEEFNADMSKMMIEIPMVKGSFASGWASSARNIAEQFEQELLGVDTK